MLKNSYIFVLINNNYMNYLQNWIFTYNSLSKVWIAGKRKDYNELFNNFSSNKIIKSSRIETLITLIIRAKGGMPKL